MFIYCSPKYNITILYRAKIYEEFTMCNGKHTQADIYIYGSNRFELNSIELFSCTKYTLLIEVYVTQVKEEKKTTEI